ncbi:YqhA family protein [Sulfurospirillum arcachonense]|uniref:YqhA family protein n=1 Tax=Sulfurospirillum arcachonense TaxID=57666 RepID=UPI000468AF80|nr:YqhA family protein [Sulfurospirillum arcachonense]
MFEKALWSSRLLTISAVIFGLLGAIILFLIASADIVHVSIITFKYFFAAYHPENFHADIVSEIIGAIDLYLIGVVLFIFSFGIYELFICEIEETNEGGESKVLHITSLDQLKDKIAKVVVMVLVVNFFQRVLHTSYDGALEMLYFAGSIMGLAIGLYFLNKVGK